MSLLAAAGASGKIRNSSGRLRSASDAGCAMDTVAAAAVDPLAFPWFLLGHSFLQCPFFPQILQFDSRMRCWSDLRLPHIGFPLDLPLPILPFPLLIGQNPLDLNFSLSFLRASTYVEYAAAMSSSDWRISLAADSKSVMNTASSSPSANKASKMSSSVHSSVSAVCT